MESREVLVLGNGRSGAAAAALLRREQWRVTVLDGEERFPDFADGRRPCFCVASPGIPLTHPWQVRARALGIPVVSEMQLGVDRFLAAGGKALAVTGSKGKSSVVKLVADAINRAGGHAVACGNYGTPVCACVDFAAASRGAWAVVEVSSFQMETTGTADVPDVGSPRFAAAAILNLQDDHLDRHGSREAYHALKRRLLDYADRAFDFSPAADAPPAVAPEDRLLAGSYFDNAVLRVNGRAGVALLRTAGLDDERIAAGFAAFEPLPHRMQTVAEIDGVRYIDDSKATSLAALVAGVGMVGVSVRLIAGGLPKGDNPKIAISVLSESVKKVYLIGASADQFHAAWKDVVACEVCGTMSEAVRRAKREARSGDTVLLSPGTASFDQFKSYGERGEVFAACVKEGLER